MSRSGYSDDCENLNLYRNAVERAMRGKRGVKFFKELRDALDGMEHKRLIAEELVDSGGDVCAMGAVFRARGMSDEEISEINYDCPVAVSRVAGIAWSMAAEIEWENDERIFWGRNPETPENRWQRIRAWVEERIRLATPL